MKLHDDQIEVLDKVRAAFLEGHRSVMLYGPTGMGKTECAISMLKATGDNFKRAAASDDGLSRLSIMQAARTQDYQPPMFIDGVKFTMTPTQALGILAFKPYTWDAAGKTFVAAGDVIDISDDYDK